VFGPWRDPAELSFPITPPLPAAAQLPTFGGTRVNLSFVLALLSVLVIWLLLRYTPWGYEIRVIGANPRVARYAGMNLKRSIVTIMAVSGALAGLAGFAVMAGVSYQLQDGISPGYGYMAIIVATLARGNPFGVVLVGILFGGLQNGGQNLEMDGIPQATVNMIQASLLFAVLAVQVLTHYRLRRTTSPAETADEPAPTVSAGVAHE
jgi:general nucleoside transport system permease protein